MTSPLLNKITVFKESEEWNTHFDGEITKVRVNGEEIMQTHDIAKKTEKLSRQIRFIGILASMIAVAVLVLVSLIYQYKANYDADLTNVRHSRLHLKNRLYELTGNIWVVDQWIVDPKWQHIGNETPSPSKIDD